MRKFFTFIFLLALINTTIIAKGKTDEVTPETDHEISKSAIKGSKIKNAVPKYTLRTPTGNPVEFKESWGYVSASRSSEYNSSIPVTDVCLFAADFNCYGELIDVPRRSLIKIPEYARCHLVVICDSKSLTHFVISSEYDVRKRAIKQIVETAKDYDGLQLDFELIPARDGPEYLSFVQELKNELNKRYGKNNKMYSICVPARMRLLTDDLFPYAKLADIFDRIFVMAYDEHWSSSKPGPIASIDWCRRCAEYAVQVVPAEKLVMGIPFYGRTWADETTAGAWYFSGANRIMTENSVRTITYEDNIPSFTYTTEVTVTGYFNDVSSALELCRLYESMNVQNIGFWRIGQEDPAFWDWLILK